jgi:UDP-glucose 4-epimerase
MRYKKKILVTGGAGYIGSITAVELIRQDYEVVIADNLSNSDAETINRINTITGVRPCFHEIDLQEKGKVKELFDEHPDILGVFHFAETKAVNKSAERLLHYYWNNIILLTNILEHMKTYHVRYIVFSSSCAVYGQPNVLPVAETTLSKPAESPFGHIKQINENILKDTIKTNQGISGIALRYFNPIGAHPSGILGELPIGVPNKLMPSITQTAIGIREQLNVFGNDYNTPDGTGIRDYIHVADLAKAHIVALERMLNHKSKAAYEVFNICTGNGISVLEAIRSFERVSGQKLNYKIVSRREGDIEQIWADTRYVNDELRWKAELGIDEMTSSAWEWEKNYRRNLSKK